VKDEKIKEEILKLFDEEGYYTEQELLFQTEMSGKGIKIESASAFYAGFKTAERLAKIEVLEELEIMLGCLYNDNDHDCIEELKNKINGVQ